MLISEGTNLSEESISCHDPDYEDCNDDDTLTVYSMGDYTNEITDTLIYEVPDGGKIITQGEVGRGHYGTVYRGSYELNDTDPPTEVAIKMFHNTNSTSSKIMEADFNREITIMKVSLSNYFSTLLICSYLLRIETQPQEHR